MFRYIQARRSGTASTALKFNAVVAGGFQKILIVRVPFKRRGTLVRKSFG